VITAAASQCRTGRTDTEAVHGRDIEIRASLAEARKSDPGGLTRDELIREITSFRRYVRWLIDVADDAADTDLDEEVSQDTLWGGVYIAPADTRKLCDNCMAVLDLVGDTPAPRSSVGPRLPILPRRERGRAASGREDHGIDHLP
jgi:hypothetical protein